MLSKEEIYAVVAKEAFLNFPPKRLGAKEKRRLRLREILDTFCNEKPCFKCNRVDVWKRLKKTRIATRSISVLINQTVSAWTFREMLDQLKYDSNSPFHLLCEECSSHKKKRRPRDIPVGTEAWWKKKVANMNNRAESVAEHFKLSYPGRVLKA